MIEQEVLDNFNVVNNNAITRRPLITKTAEAFHFCSTAPLACVEQMIAAEEADPEAGEIPEIFRDVVKVVFSGSLVEEMVATSNENRKHQLALLKTLVALKPTIVKALEDHGLDPETGRFKES